MKELYFFDQLYYNSLLGLHKRLLIPINELSQFYNRMGLKEPFSERILAEAVNDSVCFVERIKGDLFKSLEKFNLPVLFSQKMKDEIIDTINELQRRINRIQEEETTFSIHSQFMVEVEIELFEINDGGEVIFPEKSNEKLKDIASTYIESEDQIEAFQLVSSINDNLSKIQTLLEKRNLPFLAGRGNKLREGILQETQDGKFWIKPGAIRKLL